MKQNFPTDDENAEIVAVKQKVALTELFLARVKSIDYHLGGFSSIYHTPMAIAFDAL